MMGAISNFFEGKWMEYTNSAREAYFNYVHYVIDALLQFTTWVTSILAHTPVEIWSGYGFKHTYNHVAFLALISIACIWAYVGVRVFWGLSTKEDFGVVVARTATVMISIKLISYVLVFFASLTNRIASVFAADYGMMKASDVLSGSDVSTVGVLLFAIILAYYVVRIMMQYAWRIGAITLAHVFAPLFAVLWIIPSQRNVLAKVTRSVMSLFIIQIAQTFEMWVFTWVTLGVSSGNILMNLLMQLGMLQVMVNTPSYVVNNLEQWVEQPQRALRDMKSLVSLPSLGVWRKIRRLIRAR